jgi:hypothetical protein
MASQYSSMQGAATLRIAFVVGSQLAWRVVEADYVSFRSRVRRRRILHFHSADHVRHFLQERIQWRRADEDFVRVNMSTPGDFPGVTFDWVHSKDFDIVFADDRADIRKGICVTVPDRIVKIG